MKVWFNNTFRFTEQLDDISQEDIARTPPVGWGESPENILLMPNMPESVKAVIGALPYPTDRKYIWCYVRPQWCELGKTDERTGSFFHCDVDAIYRCVAPDWYDFKELLVSFGNISETEYITDSLNIEVNPVPQSSDYVTLSPYFNNGQEWKTASQKNGQVVEYTMRDVHRAGPIRRTGWRLVIVCFATNAEPATTWPPEITP